LINVNAKTMWSKLGRAAAATKAGAKPCQTALKSRGLKPGQARAKPFSLALARPEDLESRSPLRPSQSRGFQAKPGRNSPNSQILYNNEICIADSMQRHIFIYTFNMKDVKMALALVSLYSKPDPTILRHSMNMLWSCKHQGDSALKFIEVKTIQAIVAMIPHKPAIIGQQTEKRFFLVEKPGLDVAIIAGIEEEFPGDEGGGGGMEDTAPQSQ
jgi:hypothetical protein